MRNITLKLQVQADRRAVVQLPDDVEPGELEATLAYDERAKRAAPAPLTEEAWDFPSLSIGTWPEDWGTLRREEMYGDDGR